MVLIFFAHLFVYLLYGSGTLVPTRGVKIFLSVCRTALRQRRAQDVKSETLTIYGYKTCHISHLVAASFSDRNLAIVPSRPLVICELPDGYRRATLFNLQQDAENSKARSTYVYERLMHEVPEESHITPFNIVKIPCTLVM
jgi:hypothetical protein